jgi:hypothetical protein
MMRRLYDHCITTYEKCDLGGMEQNSCFSNKVKIQIVIYLQNS